MRSDDRDGGSTITDAPVVPAEDKGSPSLAGARADVAAAEARLEAVLAELRVSPRAEKVAVSRAIEDALERLRGARNKLSAAELVTSSGGR